MFSGIVSSIGRVIEADKGIDARFVIQTGFPADSLALGASIAHGGVCLTVVAIAQGRHSVDVSAETLRRTTLGDWDVGTEVNLERSLKLGDEIGGHLVYGHVDGLARVLAVAPEGQSLRFDFEAPQGLSRYIASKGSIALDGVSLTVNEVAGARFSVNIIPHTLECTTFRNLNPGHRVNLEIDMLARYVARQLAIPV